MLIAQTGLPDRGELKGLSEGRRVDLLESYS
jgi:hypothetical protein